VDHALRRAATLTWGSAGTGDRAAARGRQVVGCLPIASELDQVLPEDPDVVAVCDEFFTDVVALAQSGNPDAMIEAADSWAESAEGSAIEAEAAAIADKLTQVARGEIGPETQELTSASTEFGTQCALHGWVPSQ
jgi:hypothetical protein